MDDLSIRLDNRRTLWVTEISRETFDDQDLDQLESDGGLFIVLEDHSEGRFEVLAKAASIWAGQQLLSLFASSFSIKPQLISG